MSESVTPAGLSAPEEPAGGTGPGHREVTLVRTSLGHYEARNVRGGTISLGAGDDADFTPVELMLAAMAGCSAVDVDHITSRRAEPEVFEVTASGDKVSSAQEGNLMSGLEVTFRVRFADGDAGDAARAAYPRSVAQSHDRLCTVTRTIQTGVPVTSTAREA